MADHKSRSKPASVESWLSQQCNDSKRSRLSGERHILELISLEAPLPGVLNKLCTAIDFQIGNVVSLVLLPDAEENHHCSVAQGATQVGLHLFSSTNILSRDRVLLGTLEIYGRDPREPTLHEYQLIERVVHLAAIALQRDDGEADFDKPSGRSRDSTDFPPERPPYIN